MDAKVKQTRKKIDVAGVPVDAIDYEELGDLVKEILAEKKVSHLMFITLSDLVLSKFKTELRTNIETASLVLPVSSAICTGAKFLKRAYLPNKIYKFEFIIKLLGAIESHGKSLYLLGGKRSVIQITESNLKSSFPGLTVVGRCAGFFPRQMEGNIITAIKKSSPALLLAADGLPGKRFWITRNNSQFNPGISLFVGDSFDVFAGKKQKSARAGGAAALEKTLKVIKNPLRIFNIFIYIAYGFMLLYYKIRKL